jgi:hypothetical protein
MGKTASRYGRYRVFLKIRSVITASNYTKTLGICGNVMKEQLSVFIRNYKGLDGPSWQGQSLSRPKYIFPMSSEWMLQKYVMGTWTGLIGSESLVGFGAHGFKFPSLLIMIMPMGWGYVSELRPPTVVAYCSSSTWYKYGEPWWSDIGRGEFVIRASELFDKPISRHLVAKHGKLGEGN